MNQPQQNQAAPYKTDPKKPITTYKVLENGDVEINQLIETTSFWHARDFISLMRQNEEALKNTRFNYSDEFTTKMRDQEEEILKEIAIMKPVLEEAEKLAKAEYEKQRHEGLKTNLIKALKDKEFNVSWWQNVWLRTKPEIREPIIKELTPEQNTGFIKCVQKLKRKNIQ